MNQYEVTIMKFEMDKNEILKEIEKLNLKFRAAEHKKNKERGKLKVVEKAFNHNKTVNIAMLCGGYDEEKFKKYEREVTIIKELIGKVLNESEIIDEKIRVMKEEMEKVELEVIKKNEKDSEKRLLDIKIISERGK